MGPVLHPDLVALQPLLGRWSGRGFGRYSTIESFDYVEEAIFSQVGKPFLAYVQKTKTVADAKPLHAETGYLRAPQPGSLELVLAHPSGITEIAVGSYSMSAGVMEIELSATAIGLTPTAKKVTSLSRYFRIEGDQLSYSLRMGAVGEPCQDHLTAVLYRQG